MKKLLILGVLIAFVGVAYAEEYQPPPRDGEGVIGNSSNGSRWRLGMFEAVDGVQFDIPFSDWKAIVNSAEDDADTSESYATLTGSTEPNLASLTKNSGSHGYDLAVGEVVQWADGDGDWLETWFRVPASYNDQMNDSVFKFVVGQTDAANDNDLNYIQYKTTIIKPGRDFRSATEKTHTVVQVPFNANEYSPQTVTLAIASPNATSPNNVVAGDLIRLRYRRFDSDVSPGADGGDNVGTSTGSLNVFRHYWVPNS